MSKMNYVSCVINNMKKCNKCDERGYIVDKSFLPNHSAHSCECGWAIQQIENKFKNVSIEDLLAYGRQRVIEKENQS